MIKETKKNRKIFFLHRRSYGTEFIERSDEIIVDNDGNSDKYVKTGEKMKNNCALNQRNSSSTRECLLLNLF